MSKFNKKCIVIGISGGIAAYKIPDLAHKLVKEGANVQIIMTKTASMFITPYTLEVISKNPVKMSMWGELNKVNIEHINLATIMDIMVIAPATANIIGKIACGIADDLLTTTVISTKAPVIFAPSMNVNMYNNPIVQRNIKTLKNMGYYFIPPDSGDLACGVKGKGRLPKTDRIIKSILKIL